MLVYERAIGTHGNIKLIDRTTEVTKSVEMWIQSTTPVDIHALIWSWTIDGSEIVWRSFDFQPVTSYQRISIVYPTKGTFFTFHMRDTKTLELDGPTEFEIEMAGTSLRPVYMKVGSTHKHVIPYINDNGVWKLAKSFIRTSGGWKEV